MTFTTSIAQISQAAGLLEEDVAFTLVEIGLLDYRSSQEEVEEADISEAVIVITPEIVREITSRRTLSRPRLVVESVLL